MVYAEYCLIFGWNMTLTDFCQCLCDSPVCLVFASDLPHITEYCIRVWSCHVTWVGLHVHLVEGVLCVRRVRCVSYWGCVRIYSVTSACLALTDRVCVRRRVWVFPVGRWDMFLSHNSSRSQVTPVFSRTYFAFFPSPVLPYTFLCVWPTNLSTTSPPEQSVSLSESFAFPADSAGQRLPGLQVVGDSNVCVCVCFHCYS